MNDLICIWLFTILFLFTLWFIAKKKIEKKRLHRQQYYQTNILTSNLWKWKRSIALKRDKHKCIHCGQPANQVHHKKYARDIGREPTEWLASVCKQCHEQIHLGLK